MHPGQTPKQGKTTRHGHKGVEVPGELKDYLERRGWSLEALQDPWIVPGGHYAYRRWLLPLLTCDREDLPLYLANFSLYCERFGEMCPDRVGKLMIGHLLAYPCP